MRRTFIILFAAMVLLAGSAWAAGDTLTIVQVNDSHSHLVPHGPKDAMTNPETLPFRFCLWQNYPNPFNPATTIAYNLPENCLVRLEIYNLLGQRVATLADGWQGAGQRAVRWEAGDLTSGIHICRFTAGDFTQTRKMSLLK
jgi:hypothetical protein